MPVTNSDEQRSVLNKPLADVVEELKLGKKITQRGLRLQPRHA